MRVKEPCIILTFSTTAAAIAFEKYGRDSGLTGRLIPVPTQITAGCGMAWKAKLTDIRAMYPGGKAEFLAKAGESGIEIEKTVEMSA